MSEDTNKSGVNDLEESRLGPQVLELLESLARHHRNLAMAQPTTVFDLQDPVFLGNLRIAHLTTLFLERLKAEGLI